jgi:predicted CXXCH cytochrome family protein
MYKGVAHMFSRFEKTLIALVFALFFAGITLVAASAQDGTPPPVQDNQDGCTKCHADFQMKWENGAHGQALSDPVFAKMWTEQGKPSACLSCHVTGYDEATGTWKEDGVTCLACHKDEGGDHPKTTMTVDATPNACGTCHTDTRFGWQDWEGSTHYQSGMDCATCHDPHSASLKLTLNLKEDNGYKDASSLCITCHEEASMNFPYSTHAQEGVTCVSCHLQHVETGETTIHAVPDHSFKASLQTCTKCHEDQMHTSGEALTPGAVNTNNVQPGTTTPLEVVEASPITTNQPSPVSPIGYAGLAALIGLASGMVLSPWLERWYHVTVKKSEEVKHDGE